MTSNHLVRFRSTSPRKNLPPSISRKRAEANFLCSFERAFVDAQCQTKQITWHDFALQGYGIPDLITFAWSTQQNQSPALSLEALRQKQKPLIIPNHFDAQTGTYLDLVTSWFDTAYVGRNGAGYFAVTISQVLKPYLLQVKREFFRFRLFHVMQLRSSYAIRLYQWAKRWEFRKNMEISVQELRNVLGANSGPDGHGTKLNLGAYADFKRRAINPAVAEINEKTDLTVSFRELKAKGSKERVSRAEALHQIKNCQQARA